MTFIAQPGRHPDADELNAFAEQALSERERGTIAAHLAECAGCREVVFLAREAAEQEIADTRTAGTELTAPTNARRDGRTWWPARNWTLVAPAAALAAGAVLVFWVEHPGPEHSGTETPVSEARAVRPVEREDGFVAQERSSRAAPPGAATHQPGEPRAAKKSAQGMTPPAPEQMDQVEALGEVGEGPRARLQAERLDGVARRPETGLAPAPMNLARPAPVAAGKPALAVTGAGWKAERKEPPADSSLTADRRGLETAQPVLLASGGPVLQRNAGIARAGEGPAAPPLRRFKLPDGSLSRAAAKLRDRTLALDEEGAVFRSEDDGRSWYPVAPQWAGKVVELTVAPWASVSSMNAEAAAASDQQLGLQPASRAQAAGGKESGKQPAAGGHFGLAAAGRTAKFELVTDRRERWVSADGVIWQRR